MRNSFLRRLSLAPLALALLLALAACSPSGSPTTTAWYETDEEAPSATTTPTTTPAPPITTPNDGPTTSLTVYLDGWSWRTLEGVDLYATTGAADYRRLDFEPLSLEDLSALLDSRPDFVAIIGARMINTDFDWSCSADGCDTAATTFDRTALLQMLTDPAQIPGYGPSYAAWDIPSALFKATVSLPEGTDAVDVLGAPEGSALEPADFVWSSRIFAEQIESLPLTAAESGSPALLLAAGLGRVFVPDPAWATDHAPYNITTFFSAPAELDADRLTTRDSRVSAAFAAGLADPQARGALAELDPNELTYLTSPTIGCAPTVLCVPAALDTAVEVVDTETFEVCLGPELLPDFDSDAGEVVVNRAPAVFASVRRSITLPAATHLNGVWGGIGPDSFSPATDPATQIFSLPPLSEGELILEVGALHLYRNTDLLGVPPLLWTQLGRVVEVGADDPVEFSADLIMEASPHLSRCS